MARKNDTTADTIDPEAMYRVELARPVRIAGIALHPNDPDVTLSGAILETIRTAVTTFTKV